MLSVRRISLIAMIVLAWPFAIIASGRALYLALCAFSGALGLPVDPADAIPMQGFSAGALGFVIATAAAVWLIWRVFEWRTANGK